MSLPSSTFSLYATTFSFIYFSMLLISFSLMQHATHRFGDDAVAVLWSVAATVSSFDIA